MMFTPPGSYHRANIANILNTYPLNTIIGIHSITSYPPVSATGPSAIRREDTAGSLMVNDGSLEHGRTGNDLAYSGYRSRYGDLAVRQRLVRAVPDNPRQKTIIKLDLPWLDGNLTTIPENINATDGHGNTYLMKLAGREFPASLDRLRQALSEYGADPNIRNNRNDTALHYAIARNANEKSELLLKHNADANAVGWQGQTPLHIAARVNDRGALFALRNHGVNLNAQDNDGNTALHLSIRYNTASFFYLLGLFESDLNLEIRNNAQRTPLLEAIFYGRRKFSEFLVGQNADTDARDGNGHNALMLAGSTDIKALINRALKKKRSLRDKTVMS
ncbi:ankyrin repeat domain-containing protein [Martelella alba]|uniref:Ankyrin repeat protein n=1 Tax=Martelella alba TaxID=2590451 RepID=A0ABY2SSC8_9HYPH|nr:ankyrin repeat domain-containing protein [Martelella alba]TKI08785.1 hypothetical protein FCN80_01670 [Martelella alba]